MTACIASTENVIFTNSAITKKALRFIRLYQ